MVYLDGDGLKAVNDRAGHLAGNELLRSVAQVLRESVRSSDIIARVGGDEFAVLLVGADPRITRQILDRLHRQLTQAGISASIGTAHSMGRTESALDNAVAESFNSTLEFELLSRQHFSTREQARRAVAGWIDEYNTVRRHSTAGMLSPVDYERRQAAAATEVAA